MRELCLGSTPDMPRAQLVSVVMETLCGCSIKVSYFNKIMITRALTEVLELFDAHFLGQPASAL